MDVENTPAAGKFEINAPQVDYVQLVLFPVLRKLFGVNLELQARSATDPSVCCWDHFMVHEERDDRTNRA